MAANTITGEQILFKIARDAREIRSTFIHTVTSQTVLICRGFGLGANDTLKYALAHVFDKGYRQITVWNAATETLTLASGFGSNVAAGEVIQVAWWDATMRALAVHAINEAIRASYPYWYQETIVDQSAATLTLAAGTYSYALPAAVDALLAIGIQPTSSDDIFWIPAQEQDPFGKPKENYRVEGQAGAFTLRVMPRYNREGAIADVWSGKKICLHYATREPEITAETGTTQLPLDYFKVATDVYLRNKLNDPNGLEANIALTKEAAREAIAKLGIGKRPPSLLVQQPQTENPKEKTE